MHHAFIRFFVASLGAVLALGAYGYGDIADQTFEVASVKVHDPSEYSQPKAIDPAQAQFIGHSLLSLIKYAYDVRTYQVKGPAWIGTEYYDILAKLPAGSQRGDVPKMLQKLLIQRFHLRVSWQDQDGSVYALVTRRTGAHLKQAEIGERKATQYSSAGYVFFHAVTMFDFCEALTPFFDRPVIDETALPGAFNIELKTAPVSDTPQSDELDLNISRLDSGAPIVAALRGLGLELKPTRASVKYLIINVVDRIPSPN